MAVGFLKKVAQGIFKKTDKSPFVKDKQGTIVGTKMMQKGVLKGTTTKENKVFGKTMKDRYRSVKTNESLKRIKKFEDTQKKIAEGKKAIKEREKLVDTKQAVKQKFFQHSKPVYSPNFTKQKELKKKGGRVGFKKGSKKPVGKTSFGMLSVKAGIDKNPNPTYADKIAGAKMKNKKKKVI
jgi:hypothetical protein